MTPLNRRPPGRRSRTTKHHDILSPERGVGLREDGRGDCSVFLGDAAFADRRTFEVAGATLRFEKAHVHEGTATILGATIVARHAGEMIERTAIVGPPSIAPSPKTRSWPPPESICDNRRGQEIDRPRPHPR